MTLDSATYSATVLRQLDDATRDGRLRELENTLIAKLRLDGSLVEYQESLYPLIEVLNEMGHNLGRWEYDSEVELWGSGSYMDPTIEDELILKSTYPSGVQLRWQVFDFDEGDA